MNIIFLEQELHDYPDKRIIEFFKYGWPIGLMEKFTQNNKFPNHRSAVMYPKEIGTYLSQEVSEGAMLGPFKLNPLSSHIFISPLCTVEKKDSSERRIITDLSFPEGNSVNDRISKGQYLGEPINLSYARVDDLVDIIKEKGKGCLLFKRDLRRAYRQIRIDPGDINVLGLSWNSNLYFDLSAVMGMSSSALMCQRTINSVRHVYKKRGYNSVAILDDVASAEVAHKSHEAFVELGSVIKEFGLEEKESKAHPPNSDMPFLGVLFRTSSLTLEVTQDRLKEILNLCSSWKTKTVATRKEVESLFGKLNFISAVVRPGRIFMSRILSFMKGLSRSGFHKVPHYLHKDVEWWEIFLPCYNGISMMTIEEWSEPDAVFASDACLIGCGAWFSGLGLFFHSQFPKFILDMYLHINALELLSIIVATKVWGRHWAGKRIVVQCDNEASVSVINTGRSRDPFLQACLRELVLIAARHQFEIRAIHIPGITNRIPDELSRWSLGPKHEERFWSLAPKGQAKEVFVYEGLFHFSHIW